MVRIKEKLKQLTRILLNIFKFLLARGFVALCVGIAALSCTGVAYLIKNKPDLPQWVTIYFVSFFAVFFILEAVQYFFHKKIPSEKYLILGVFINLGIWYYYSRFSIMGLLTYIMVIAYPFLTPTN